jgi:hypothetical protein
LYDVDSVNFALALKRFDPAAYQPHPPGYFLYVCLGRLVNLVFHDANTALVAISIAFSCGAVAMIYLLAGSWFGTAAARFAGLIFLFSPLAWFHGTVALTYIVEAFFSALVGYLCWRGRGISAGVALGVAGGFRPSSILFLAPLLLFSLRKDRRVVAVLALILTTASWFIPMIHLSGGIAYFSSLASLWTTVPGKASVFNSTALNSFARAITIAGIYFLCFGCAALLPVKGIDRDERDKRRFTWIWVTPALLFFTFVFLKFVNAGYLLILMPPVCAWLGLRASLLRWRPVAFAGCAAINTAIFLFAPVYCSYGEVRAFERELSGVIAVLPQIAPPGSTMIVGLDSHFLGYRHAGYYLPQYRIVQFPEVQLAAGETVFAMARRETTLERHFDETPIRNFVIFPLPSNDSEYADFMAQVRRRLPSSDVRLISRANHDFALAPVSDLHFLFPVVGR